jgi:hypothetical protein
MTVKPRINESIAEKVNERFDKQIGRAYLIWLVGLFVGALHLKPEKVDYAGISFTIDSSEKLQGIIYFGCLLVYVGIVGVAILFGLQNVNSNVALKRRIIYGALGKKRTIVGLDKRGHAVLRSSARFTYSLAVLCLAVITFLPAIHIIFFQQGILLTGLDAIFQTVSLKNGSINPIAPATLLLTLPLMSAWTVVMYRLLQRLLGPQIQLLFVNMMSAATFAFLDKVFRTHESYGEASFRAIGLQTMILFICYLPKIIVSPFMGWLSLRLAYFRWKLRRAEKKKKQSQK